MKITEEILKQTLSDSFFIAAHEDNYEYYICLKEDTEHNTCKIYVQFLEPATYKPAHLLKSATIRFAMQVLTDDPDTEYIVVSYINDVGWLGSELKFEVPLESLSDELKERIAKHETTYADYIITVHE